MSREQKTFSISGIDTYSDVFSSTAEGSFESASNVVIDQQNLLSPRRGFEGLSLDVSDGTELSMDDVQSVFTIQDKKHLQKSTGELYYYDDDKQWWVEYSETVIAPDEANRGRTVDANLNTYMTGKTGVRKFTDAGSDILNAGIATPAAPVSTSVVNTTPGIDPNQVIAFRVVFGYKDDNNNLILSAPSDKIIRRTDGFSNPVSIGVTVQPPPGVKKGWFAQLYRTTAIASTGTEDPGDTMYLVTEKTVEFEYPTTFGISDASDNDTVLSGTPLYTNTTQEGILAANTEPPRAIDVVNYQGRVFYANTQPRNSSATTFYGFGSNGIKPLDRLVVNETHYIFVALDFFGTDTVTFDGTLASGNSTITSVANTRMFEVGQFLGGTGIPVGTTILSKTSSTIVMSNNATASGATNIKYYTSVPGAQNGTAAEPYQVPLYARESTVGATPSISDDIIDTLTQLSTEIRDNQPEVYVSYSSVDNIGLLTVSERDMGDFGTEGFPILLTGDETSSSAVSEPLLTHFSTVDYTVGSTTASVADTTLISVGDTFWSDSLTATYTVERILNSTDFLMSAAAPGTVSETGYFTSYKAVGELRTNRVYYSKFQEPESVPLLNYLDVGSQESKIKRILATRTGILVFMERSVYRITGTTPNTFQVNLVDNTVALKAEDSIAIFENSVLGLFDMGICAVTLNQVTPISDNVKGELLEIFGATGDSLNSLAFAFNYDSYGKFVVCVPSTAQSTTADKAYVYNNDTSTWTTWDLDATHMTVDTVEDKIIKLSSSGVSRERKDFDYQDIADEGVEVTVTAVSGTELTIDLAAIPSLEVGYMYYQSPTQFSRITAIDASAGKITLEDDLSWDLSSFTITGDAVADFDEITSVSGSVDVYAGATVTGSTIPASKTKVTSVSGTTLTLNRSHTGSATGETYTITQTYKALPPVEVDVTWNPIYMGSPAILKQFTESTVLTTSAISDLTLRFKGITSASYEDITFTTESIGAWGLFAWGESNWGGEPSVLRYRTYIPRSKQRDSAIYPRIQSSAIFNNFEVSGLSIIYRPLSSRTVR